MRVLVCGGRTFSDRNLLNETLDRLRQTGKIECVIHGDAPGADRMAEDWAVVHGIEVEAYAAQWSVHGRAAGAIRNRQMLEEGKPDLVVAFRGGSGTRNMVEQAVKANVQVFMAGD